MQGGLVYILASQCKGTLYVGVTSDIRARTWQHKSTPKGFVARYSVSRWVHVEEFPTIAEAIAREKAIKKWRRAWKFELIEKTNPDWSDLFDVINA